MNRSRISMWLRPWLHGVRVAAVITGIFLLLRFAASIGELINPQPWLTGLIIFVMLTVFFGLIFSLIQKPIPDASQQYQANDFPKIADNKTINLDEIYQWAVTETESQIRWYSRSREPKRWGSRLLRGMAIVFGALGALAPVIASIFNQEQSTIIGWGYVSLATAGACIAGDRLFGLSSGWIRYILTEFTLQQMLDEFRIDWTMQITQGKTQSELLQIIKTFHQSVLDTVKKETDAWAAEFQTNLSDLERMVQTSAETQKAAYEERKKVETQEIELQRNLLNQRDEARKPGDIHVVVMNAKNFDSVEISVFDDHKQITLKKVAEGLIRSVQPGLHEIQAKGVLAGQDSFDQQVIDVQPGAVTRVEFTL